MNKIICLSVFLAVLVGGFSFLVISLMQRSTTFIATNFDSDLLDLVRKDRTTEITEATDLQKAAEVRAAHFCGNPLSHAGWKDSFKDLPYTYVGENLAQGYESATDTEAAFIASQEHRDNIVDPKFQYIGIGQRCNTVVELFGGY